MNEHTCTHTRLLASFVKQQKKEVDSFGHEENSRILTKVQRKNMGWWDGLESLEDKDTK